MKKKLHFKDEFKVFLIIIFASVQTAIFSQISSTPTGGNWGEATTWVGGNVPQAADNVIIAAGATVDLNVAGACNNINVLGTFRLSTASRAFTSTGTTTIAATGAINFTTTTTATNVRSFNDIVVNAGGTWNSQSLVTVTGNITNNGTFTAVTGGTFTLSGTGKSFSGTNINISSTTITISGTYTNNSTDLKFDGTFSGTGSLTNAANSSLILAGATNSITTLVASASPNTVTYSRLGTQQIKGATYHNLIISGNNTKTIQASVTVNNNLNIGTGTVLYDNGFQIIGTANGTLTVDGELQLGAAAATGIPTNFGTVNFNTGSTIHFSTTNAAGQQIDHTKSYHNLRVSGVSQKTITGNIMLPGNLTITSGTLNVGSFNITVRGNSTVAGTQTGEGKIILSGGSAEHSLLGTGSYTNLELNDAQGASLGANLTVNGTLTLSQGALKTLSRSITLNGSFAGSGAGVISTSPTESGDIIVGGTNGGSAGTLYMAASPNNAIRRFTFNRTGNGASLTIGSETRIREQLNLINGSISHGTNLSLGITTNIMITKIVNGTLVTPPVFNTFTGAYRVEYGDGTLLSNNITTGTQGEIPSTNTVERIILNNNTQNTITLGADITVTGTITFTSGKLTLNDKNLITTYTGTGATGGVNSYIVTNGTGQFFRNIPAATTGNFNFPVGTQDRYSLVNINFIDNSNMSAGRIGARVVGSAPPVGETVSYLNKHWIFTDDRTGTAYTYRPTFTFNNAEVTGTPSQLMVGRFAPTAWSVFPPSTVTATTLTMQSGSITVPLSGEGVLFSGLSEPIGVTPPASVWEVIVNSENHNTLESLVLAAGLDGALQGQGPFTVFAPTDAAFANVPQEILNALAADPQGALADVLKYHVVAGTAALSNSLTNGQVIATLLTGKSVTVNIIGTNILINDALVTIADIIADNGIVHVINAVLIPEDETSVNNLFSNKIKIYPNPAKESFFIDCFECANTSYEIMTIDGKVVRSGRLINERELIMKGNLSAGIYLVKIFNEKGFSSRKVIFE
jgi:hypothetical protein